MRRQALAGLVLVGVAFARISRADDVPSIWYLPESTAGESSPRWLVQLDVVPWSGDETGAAPGDVVDHGRPLAVQRLYAGMAWRENHLTAAVVANLAPGIDRGELAIRPIADAYIAYDRLLWLTPVAGVTRLPLARWSLAPEIDQALPPPMAIVELAPDRRAGVAIAGDLGIVRYVTGAFALAPPLVLAVTENAPAQESGVLSGGRIEIEPVGPVGRTLDADTPDSPWYWRPRVAVGGAAFAGAGGTAQGIVLVAADLALKDGPVALTVEGLLDHEPGGDREGGYAELGAFAVPACFEVIVRGDLLRVPATSGARAAGTAGLRWVDRRDGWRTTLAASARGRSDAFVLLQVSAGTN